jgi:hypothetical protein
MAILALRAVGLKADAIYLRQGWHKFALKGIIQTLDFYSLTAAPVALRLLRVCDRLLGRGKRTLQTELSYGSRAAHLGDPSAGGYSDRQINSTPSSG